MVLSVYPMINFFKEKKMINWIKPFHPGVTFAATLFSLTVLISPSWADSTSSCEVCHLDEDRLTETLKVDTSTSSAMQSGSG